MSFSSDAGEYEHFFIEEFQIVFCVWMFFQTLKHGVLVWVWFTDLPPQFQWSEMVHYLIPLKIVLLKGFFEAERAKRKKQKTKEKS